MYHHLLCILDTAKSLGWNTINQSRLSGSRIQVLGSDVTQDEILRGNLRDETCSSKSEQQISCSFIAEINLHSQWFTFVHEKIGRDIHNSEMLNQFFGWWRVLSRGQFFFSLFLFPIVYQEKPTKDRQETSWSFFFLSTINRSMTKIGPIVGINLRQVGY